LLEFQEEGFIIINRQQKSKVIYFSNLKNEQSKFVYSQVDSNVKGYSIGKYGSNKDNFYIDILTVEDGLCFYKFDKFSEEIKVQPKTDKLYESIENLINPCLNVYPIINEKSSIKSIFGSYISNEKPTYNLVMNTEMDLSTKLNKFENSGQCHIIGNSFLECFDKYINKRLDSFQREGLITEVNKVKRKEFAIIFENIIKFIIDNDAGKIDITNKESIKAELIIIEYLKDKEDKLEKLKSFLDYLKLTDKNTFPVYLMYREKMVAAIQIREMENKILEKRLNETIERVETTEIIRIFQNAFLEIKNSMEGKQSFIKHTLYSKVNFIILILNTYY